MRPVVPRPDDLQRFADWLHGLGVENIKPDRIACTMDRPDAVLPRQPLSLRAKPPMTYVQLFRLVYDCGDYWLTYDASGTDGVVARHVASQSESARGAEPSGNAADLRH
jgi:hypothetical protein